MRSKKKVSTKKTPDITRLSNEQLFKSRKTQKVLAEVKRRTRSGKIKLPKGFNTKKSSVSDLMDLKRRKK